MRLGDLCQFNPSTKLERKGDVHFVDMASLPTMARDITSIEQRPAASGGAKFVNDDTLMARITPCLENGKGALVAGLPDGVAGQGSTEFIVLRAYDHRDAQFLYYITRNPSFHSYAVQRMTGTSGRQRVSWQSLVDYEIVDLSPEERHEIGNILGALDDKISLNAAMNKTLEASARALFRDWFINFGPTLAKAQGEAAWLAPDLWSLFPGRLGDNGVPEGWTVGKLADVACVVATKADPSTVGADTPYIGLEHMPRRSIALAEWEGADKVTSGKSGFRVGDILFGKLRPYFHKVGLAAVDGICSTDIIVMNAKKPFDHALALICVSSDEFVAFTDRGSTGTKMPRTSWGNMSQYPVTIANEQIRQAFEAMVAPMLDQIMANIRESRSIAKTRDALLPELMSGQVRVAEVKRFTGVA